MVSLAETTRDLLSAQIGLRFSSFLLLVLFLVLVTNTELYAYVFTAQGGGCGIRSWLFVLFSSELGPFVSLRNSSRGLRSDESLLYLACDLFQFTESVSGYPCRRCCRAV